MAGAGVAGSRGSCGAGVFESGLKLKRWTGVQLKGSSAALEGSSEARTQNWGRLIDRVRAQKVALNSNVCNCRIGMQP